jgi:hypothetical protein
MTKATHHDVMKMPESLLADDMKARIKEVRLQYPST